MTSIFRFFQTRSVLAIGFAILFASYIFANFINQHYLDYLWFASQDYGWLWWEYLQLQYTHYGIGVFLAGIGYLVSFSYARIRLGSRFRMERLHWILIIAAVLFALLFIHGPTLQQIWEASVLANANAKEYGMADPLYGKDISFFILRLDYWNLLSSWAMFTIIFLTIATTALYLLPLLRIRFEERSQSVMPALRYAGPHLAFFLCAFLFTLAFQFYLDRYELLINGSSEKVAGASYMDVNAKTTGSIIMAYASGLLGLLILFSTLLRRFRWVITVSAVWFVLYLFILKVFPWIVFYTKVYSNQYQAEEQYIAHSIQYTREAYDLHKIQKIPFPANQGIRASDIAENPLTLKNLRIWDYQPLQKTFSQLQEFRQYYEFTDIDIDRYTINGEMRQVLISGRELNHSKLPDPAQTWESRHLQYTHGYGLVMAPSNQFNNSGQPNLWIRDMPPRTTAQVTGLPELQEPSIYFGEQTNTYAIVNTSLDEIHYPTADRFAATRYEEEAGVKLGSMFSLRRIAYALAEGSWKFLLSEYIQPNSRILYYRNIHQIVRKLAPFLTYDGDPYLVLGENGKLYWIMDAYTVSDRFPYSEHLGKRNRDIAGLGKFRRYNYVRNSVKIVINAKTGKTKFYTFAEDEVILAAWKKIFPGLFYSVAEFPSDLLSHIRYPEELFRIQANIYGNYHTDDTQTFYNLEDLWQLPRNHSDGSQREPYYSVVKILQTDKQNKTPNQEEYLLMTPFLAYNKENMITWLLARCDYTRETPDGKNENPNRYGELILFDFPRTKQIYGPKQIEARTDQDPEISKDLTLWNQQGSGVIRGQLLIVPVGETLLYTQSIYLESSNSPLPELRRIVASDGKSLVMSNNLGSAIRELANRSLDTGDNFQGSEDFENVEKSKAPDSSPQDKLKQADILMQQAKEHLKNGDWDRFGESMQDLERTLTKSRR